MSLIPIVIFGLVVLTAIAGHFVEKKHGVSKDELATLLAPMVSRLPLQLFAYAAPKKARPDEPVKLLTVLLPLIVRVTLTVIFTAAGLWILFSPGFGDEEKRWSSATLGTVLGYWLK